MIELRLEAPIGQETMDRSFPSPTNVRVTGQVTGLAGVPEPMVPVRVTLTSYTRGIIQSWQTRTNWGGSYWIDTTTPSGSDNYTYQASWDPLIGPWESSEPIGITTGGAVPLPPSTLYPRPTPLPPAEAPEGGGLFEGVSGTVKMVIVLAVVVLVIIILVQRRV